MIRVTGTAQTVRNLRSLGTQGPLVVEAALFEVGSLIEGDAKMLVPVDTGVLRASGFTLTQTLARRGDHAGPSPEARALAQNTATEVRAVVGFGGPAVKYALVQHERTDYRHRVGQAKYLETPYKARVGTIPAVVAKHVRRAVERVSRGSA